MLQTTFEGTKEMAHINSFTTQFPQDGLYTLSVNESNFGSNDSIDSDLLSTYWLNVYCHISFDNIGHCLVFFMFALVGVLGNIALLFAILLNKHLLSAPNIFIVNLTIADLVYLLATAPFNIRHELTPCWSLGSYACKIKHYVPLVAQATCVLSLAALSRERYSAIVKGLESRVQRSARRTMCIVSLCWITGFIIALPVLFITETRLFGLLCQYMPMDDLGAKGYILFTFIALYVMPFSVVAIHYTQVARTLVRNNIVQLADNQTAIRQFQARKRLAVIVMTITIFFGFFWFPYHVYHMWYMFTRNPESISGNKSHVQFFRHFYHYMSLANSCLNPWVVFLMSSAHRSPLINFCKHITCRDVPSKADVRRQNQKISMTTSSAYYAASTSVSRV